jgi:hypothetical protein
MLYTSDSVCKMVIMGATEASVLVAGAAIWDHRHSTVQALRVHYDLSETMAILSTLAAFWISSSVFSNELHTDRVLSTQGCR